MQYSFDSHPVPNQTIKRKRPRRRRIPHRACPGNRNRPMPAGRVPSQARISAKGTYAARADIQATTKRPHLGESVSVMEGIYLIGHVVQVLGRVNWKFISRNLIWNHILSCNQTLAATLRNNFDGFSFIFVSNSYKRASNQTHDLSVLPESNRF